MTCLVCRTEADQEEPLPNALIGTQVSSLHRLKDTDNHDGAFFVFGDLSVKQEGRFRLLFSLHKMVDNAAMTLASTTSDVFQVFATKSFPGLAESTFLTRSFSDQGVRLRLRKDSRASQTRKRNATAADFARKHPVHSHRDHPSHRGIPGRAGSNEEGMPYGTPNSVYDGQPGYGYDVEGMNKRQRMSEGPPSYGHGGQQGYGYDVDDMNKRQRLSDASPAYTTHNGQSGYGGYDVDDMSKRQRLDGNPAYGHDIQYQRSTYPPQMQLPASTAPFTMPSQPTAPPYHLARLETQPPGYLPPL